MLLSMFGMLVDKFRECRNSYENFLGPGVTGFSCATRDGGGKGRHG